MESQSLEHLESACIFRLTKLPLLTYPLIIEELRPGDTPCGRFAFSDIADPDSDVALSGGAHRHVRPASDESHPMGLVFAPSQIESWLIDRLCILCRNRPNTGRAKPQIEKQASGRMAAAWEALNAAQDCRRFAMPLSQKR